MTLKMTKRESVCESVGEGESRRGQKGGGRELLCTLSYTHTPCSAPPSNLAERRGHRGGGCQHREGKTDRQLVGQRGQTEGGKGEGQARPAEGARL